MIKNYNIFACLKSSNLSRAAKHFAIHSNFSSIPTLRRNFFMITHLVSSFVRFSKDFLHFTLQRHQRLPYQSTRRKKIFVMRLYYNKCQHFVVIRTSLKMHEFFLYSYHITIIRVK